jgi:hypothetical protein
MNVAAGTVRHSHLAELKPSTCEAVFEYRDESLATSALLAPNFALTPAASPSLSIEADDSLTAETDVSFTAPTATIGSAFHTLWANMPFSSRPYETRSRVSTTYSTYNGCFATLHLRNAVNWSKTSDFGWGVENFNVPELSNSDPTGCSSVGVNGIAYLSSNPVEPNDCIGSNFHTNYSNWLTVWPNHNITVGTDTDIYTGSCQMQLYQDDGAQ